MRGQTETTCLQVLTPLTACRADDAGLCASQWNPHLQGASSLRTKALTAKPPAQSEEQHRSGHVGERRSSARHRPSPGPLRSDQRGDIRSTLQSGRPCQSVTPKPLRFHPPSRVKTERIGSRQTGRKPPRSLRGSLSACEEPWTRGSAASHTLPRAPATPKTCAARRSTCQPPAAPGAGHPLPGCYR